MIFFLIAAITFMCDKRCNKKRSCGRHKCNEVCCVVSLRVASLSCSLWCAFGFGCDVRFFFLLLYFSIFVHLQSLFAVLVILKKLVCVRLFCSICFVGIIINVKPCSSLKAIKSMQRCFYQCSDFREDGKGKILLSARSISYNVGMSAAEVLPESTFWIMYP